MKIAILSDIHGNLPALEAVTADVQAWGADRVIVNGDTVNRGPKSGACWRFVQAHGWAHTRGNHEHFVLARANGAADEGNGRLRRLYELSRWTAAEMGAAALELAQTTAHASLFVENGRELRCTHASMGNHMLGIYTDTPREAVRQQIGPPPAVFVTSHTHKPHIRQVDETLIVNNGSVGQPCDGDVRASYAQIVWINGRWQAQIVRIPYDRAQTRRDFEQSGMLEATSGMTRLIFAEWEHASDVLIPWRQQYQAAYLAGEIELETAVDAYLDALTG